MLQKLSLAMVGTAILTAVAIQPAAATTFKFEGRFADISTCTNFVLFPPGVPTPRNRFNEPCKLGHEGQTFSGKYEVDESANNFVTKINLLEANNFPQFLSMQAFLASFVSQSPEQIHLALGFESTWYAQLLRLNFAGRSTPKLTDQPGAFLNGRYYQRTGSNFGSNYTTDVVAASIIRISKPTTSVPEPGVVAGLSVLGLGWLLQRKMTGKVS